MYGQIVFLKVLNSFYVLKTFILRSLETIFQALLTVGYMERKRNYSGVLALRVPRAPHKLRLEQYTIDAGENFDENW